MMESTIQNSMSASTTTTDEEYWSPSDDKEKEIDPEIFDLDNYF